METVKVEYLLASLLYQKPKITEQKLMDQINAQLRAAIEAGRMIDVACPEPHQRIAQVSRVLREWAMTFIVRKDAQGVIFVKNKAALRAILRGYEKLG